MEGHTDILVIVPQQEKYTSTLRRKTPEQLEQNSRQMHDALQKALPVILKAGVSSGQIELLQNLGCMKIHGIASDQRETILQCLADSGLLASTIEAEVELTE